MNADGDVIDAENVLSLALRQLYSENSPIGALVRVPEAESFASLDTAAFLAWISNAACRERF